MSTDNTQRRNRAIAAIGAVPTHYRENEEGITDAITDLLHLAANHDIDVEALLSRCRNNYETEAADEGRTAEYHKPERFEFGRGRKEDEAVMEGEQRGKYELDAEAEAVPRRYAIVVVIEAESPEAAGEGVRGTVGALEGDGEPDCIYIGAPWQSIPADAEDLSTEQLTLGMSVPDANGGFYPATRELRPCE